VFNLLPVLDMPRKQVVMANVFPKLNKNIRRGKLAYFIDLQKTVGKLGNNAENPNVVFFIRAWK
jgi:Zn-dependent protease